MVEGEVCWGSNKGSIGVCWGVGGSVDGSDGGSI